MATITLCSSADFYRQAVEIERRLEGHGFKVLIPLTAEKMKLSNDYDVTKIKTWLSTGKGYHKKSALIREHFSKVSLANAILVINNPKHGKDNYIGGNVLMEMSLAFYLKIPIYILNDIPKESSYLEEILGMSPIILKGDLDKLIKQLS